jgi:hypothetical protein
MPTNRSAIAARRKGGCSWFHAGVISNQEIAILKLPKTVFVFACALSVVQPTAKANAKREECTSMCHLFEAYALAQVCPNFTFSQEYWADFKDLFAGSRATPRFKAEAMNAVLSRISKAVNVCSPSCLKLEIKEGTACQYLQSRPIVPDEE